MLSSIGRIKIELKLKMRIGLLLSSIGQIKIELKLRMRIERTWPRSRTSEDRSGMARNPKK